MNSFKITAVLFLICNIYSCGKYDLERTNPYDPDSKNATPAIPLITTSTITAITTVSATGGGNITSDGSSGVTARGICWGTSALPTVLSTKTIDGVGTGSFISALTGLIPGTKYYVRAYASNSAGTGYGSVVSFTTSVVVSPALTTVSVSSLNLTSASSGGKILTDGGGTITAKGVCWSTVANPTVTNSKTSDGTGSGNFTSSITGLTADTKYFVRAYATNIAGTGYGDEFSFLTPTADIEGNVYNTVTIGTQIWMTENLKTTKYRDGTSIPIVTSDLSWFALTTPGCCWYSNNITNKGIYGVLYNWYAIDPAANGNKNVCPTGWHLPTDSEWTILTLNYGGDGAAGGSLKETGTLHWTTNSGATNLSGFTALPGGLRILSTFNELGTKGVFWTSTTVSNSNNWIREIYNNNGVYRSSYGSTTGLSVRCIRD